MEQKKLANRPRSLAEGLQDGSKKTRFVVFNQFNQSGWKTDAPRDPGMAGFGNV